MVIRYVAVYSFSPTIAAPTSVMASSCSTSGVQSESVVSDLHLALIAEKIPSWEDKLAFFLGLQDVDVRAIKKDRIGEYHLQKLECLLVWKRRCDDCSYKCLLKVLKKCGMNVAYSFISSELLKCSHNSEDSSHEADRDSDAGGGFGKTRLLDPKIEEDLEYQLRENMREIRNRYAFFVQHILLSLKEKDIDADDLRSFILNLPAFTDTNSRQAMLWTGRSVDFEEAGSINDIFKILVRDCCSFLDCNIFEQIMVKYEVDSNDPNIVQYYEDLKMYVEKHKASEFALINPSLSNLTYSSTEMHLKFDVDEMQYRLGDMKELKRAVARILGLRPSTLTIHGIKQGCIVLTVLIPTSVAEVLFSADTRFSAEQKKQFQDISMMWLQCGRFMFNCSKRIEPEQIEGQADLTEVPPDPDFSEAVTTFDKMQSAIESLLTLRDETLKTLYAFQGSIETSYNNSRKTMIGGSAVAIGGSVLGIVGFTLAPVSFGTSLGLGIFGGVVAAAGGMTIAAAEIWYTVVSRKMLKEVNQSCAKDRELMQQLHDSGEKFEELLKVLTERYQTSADSMFQLIHRNSPKKLLEGVIHTGRIAKTATSTTRAILAGSRTVWATLRPAIRVFGIVSAAIDAVFIPIDIGVLLKSSYDVFKHKRGESNSWAAKGVQTLIDDLSSHRDKIQAVCDELHAHEASDYQTRDEFSHYVVGIIDKVL